MYRQLPTDHVCTDSCRRTTSIQTRQLLTDQTTSVQTAADEPDHVCTDICRRTGLRLCRQLLTDQTTSVQTAADGPDHVCTDSCRWTGPRLYTIPSVCTVCTHIWWTGTSASCRWTGPHRGPLEGGMAALVSAEHRSTSCTGESRMCNRLKLYSQALWKRRRCPLRQHGGLSVGLRMSRLSALPPSDGTGNCCSSDIIGETAQHFRDFGKCLVSRCR